MKNKIRIAIQKKGRLFRPSLKFLKNIGLDFNARTKDLAVPCKKSKIELLFVRNSDIPEYVKAGVADFGIVGENVLFERGDNLEIIKRLGFGKCSLIIAVPKNSQIKNLEDLQEERIATSYPKSLQKYLKKNSINASLIEIRGSVEIAPKLNLADAICDITQTGRTIMKNGLSPLFTLFNSEAVMIKSPYLSNQKRNYFRNFLTN